MCLFAFAEVAVETTIFLSCTSYMAAAFLHIVDIMWNPFTEIDENRQVATLDIFPCSVSQADEHQLSLEGQSVQYLTIHVSNFIHSHVPWIVRAYKSLESDQLGRCSPQSDIIPLTLLMRQNREKLAVIGKQAKEPSLILNLIGQIKGVSMLRFKMTLTSDTYSSQQCLHIHSIQQLIFLLTGEQY